MNDYLSPAEFPNAVNEPFLVTSPSSGVYNCIAWALGSQEAFIWPSASRQFEWPADLPRKNSLPVFTQFFQKHGFETCPDGSPERKFLKIALFMKNGKPTHAARLLENGFWTSKIGGWVDVQHTLEAMEGGLYGKAVKFFKKERSN